jgi:hypothetical protein
MTPAVCRWPVTAEARVPSQASPCEICSEYSGTVTVFLSQYLGFPYQYRGYALVEALRYKPEGRGFDSRW